MAHEVRDKATTIYASAPLRVIPKAASGCLISSVLKRQVCGLSLSRYHRFAGLGGAVGDCFDVVAGDLAPVEFVRRRRVAAADLGRVAAAPVEDAVGCRPSSQLQSSFLCNERVRVVPNPIIAL